MLMWTNLNFYLEDFECIMYTKLNFDVNKFEYHNKWEEIMYYYNFKVRSITI